VSLKFTVKVLISEISNSDWRSDCRVSLLESLGRTSRTDPEDSTRHSVWQGQLATRLRRLRPRNDRLLKRLQSHWHQPVVVLRQFRASNHRLLRRPQRLSPSRQDEL